MCPLWQSDGNGRLPHGAGQLGGLLDNNLAVKRDAGELYLIDGIAVTIEKHSHALLEEFVSLHQIEVRPPELIKERV